MIKDSGERRLAPPFGDEHEELRATVRRWVESRGRAPPGRVGGGARVPARAVRAAPASSASSASSTRSRSVARAATTCTTPCSPRRSPRPGSPAASAPGSAPTPGSRLRRSGSSAPPSSRSASCAPAIAGEKIAALGITEPGAGSDVAGIRTQAQQRRRWLHRQRLEDVHHQRGAGRLHRLRGEDDRRTAATTGSRFLVLEREMDGYEVTAKLEKMGWHASDTGELSFTDVAVPGGEPARGGERAAST